MESAEILKDDNISLFDYIKKVLETQLPYDEINNLCKPETPDTEYNKHIIDCYLFNLLNQRNYQKKM